MRPRRKIIVSKSPQSSERWKKLNASLNNSYKDNEAAALKKQMTDLRLADKTGNYTTKQSEGKKRVGTAPWKEQKLLHEWKRFFSSLLNKKVVWLRQNYPHQQKIFPFVLIPLLVKRPKRQSQPWKPNTHCDKN